MKKPVIKDKQKETLSRKKLILFKFIAVLLPFLLLLLIELALRVFGYGHNVSLFIEDPKEKQYWVMNDYVSRKYFTAKENATTGYHEIFKKAKTPDIVRIFVLGESTTQGFPYTYNGSFHRWLKYRLMHTFPEKNFEIINLSLTAVNSYTVLDFAKEVIKFQPDMVLIYVGHNEYYGALGVGSTSNLGNNPHLVRFIIKLREFRLVQLLISMAHRISNSFSSKKSNIKEQLMQRMAADQHIAYGSKKYERGIRQFEMNMIDVCKLLSKRKIPVLISNLVSNERDLKPFISDTTNNEKSAIYQYQLAGQAYNQGNFQTAKQLYVRAKDLDLLRFRAPEAMNQILVKITNQFPGIYLVDTKTLFEQNSPHGILGKELILEHVHPNLLGYALLSDAFYQALKKYNFIVPDSDGEMSFKQLLKDMPVNQVDSLKGADLIARMKKDWPFNEPGEFKAGNSFEAKLADDVVMRRITWPEAMDSLERHDEKTNDWLGAYRVAEGGVLEYPYNIASYQDVVRIGTKLGMNDQAAFYLRKAFQLEPDLEKAQSLVVLLMKIDSPELAISYLDYMILNNNSNATYGAAKSIVQEIVRLKTALRNDTANTNLMNSIADYYLRMNNKEIAAKYVAKALLKDPANKTSLELAAKIKMTGN